ncbi:tautomerase family protein [Streptomyces sp. NPDC050264]|uniref:tautomerase family protein n=1 Tax=Streptomyces sp. NPDC050264 TaxID=3155038 RepID=UPI00342AE714
MPQVTITIAEGRTPGQLRTLLHEVHEAVLRSVDTRPEHIRVVVHEVPRTHWATGDLTLAEMRAAASTDGSGHGRDAASLPPP